MEELAKNLPQRCADLLPKVDSFFLELSNAKPVHYKGHILGTVFPAETVRLANEKWRPKDGDVLVASHKKTGTSWTREIVRLIIYMNDPELERLSRAVPMVLNYIEAGPPCSLEILDNIPLPRRILVSHSVTQILNLEEYLKRDIKVIHVMRNPKDQAVSLYHFVTSGQYATNPIYAEVKDWNSFFDTLIAGRLATDVLEGEFYPYYILSWHPYRNHPKVLFLRYEDLKKPGLTPPYIQHHVALIKQIASFIGCELSHDDAEKIAERTTFKSMKNNDQLADSKVFKSLKMLRKGEVGEWKNYFTVAQSEKMDEIIGEKLKGTGITFEYE